jgi:cob(I)alamin adenosyltransferase
MAFEDYKKKDSVVIVYTGNSKGKTSASIGLMCRALGRNWRVAYIQFIKSWEVGEHTFIRHILPLYQEKLTFFKGGKGFYNAGDLSEKAVDEDEHQRAALDTYKFALACATSNEYDLVICDELSNAVNDGLLSRDQLETLLTNRTPSTSVCITGRNFPSELLKHVDIATSMGKIKHHFDDKFIANEGIDY